jgi:cyclophilin family peptidyl-prolyl cis-trans isomerase/protein-disulfide isomerase
MHSPPARLALAVLTLGAALAVGCQEAAEFGVIPLFATPVVGTIDPASVRPVAPSATPTPHLTPTPLPTPTADQILLAEVDALIALREGDWTRGPDDAPVTVIEYGDFASSACAELVQVLNEITARYPDDVRLIYRHFPQPEANPLAPLAAQAAEAAGGQGAFWPMHDLLYANQAEWVGLSEDGFRGALRGYAEELGLDVDKFDFDLDSGVYSGKVSRALDFAEGVGLRARPTLFVNGQYAEIPPDVEVWDLVVRVEVLAARYSEPPEMLIDPQRHYTATIVTEGGEIVVELFADLAPVSVNNFVYLAREGFYDDTTFYRVLPGRIAQGGDPTNSGAGGVGYTIPDEADNGLTFDRGGLLSFALPAGPDSANGQFFITYAPLDDFDGEFTVFGEVIEGYEVLIGLTSRDPDVMGLDAPPGDRIKTIIINEE